MKLHIWDLALNKKPRPGDTGWGFLFFDELLLRNQFAGLNGFA